MEQQDVEGDKRIQKLLIIQTRMIIQLEVLSHCHLEEGEGKTMVKDQMMQIPLRKEILKEKRKNRSMSKKRMFNPQLHHNPSKMKRGHK